MILRSLLIVATYILNVGSQNAIYRVSSTQLFSSTRHSLHHHSNTAHTKKICRRASSEQRPNIEILSRMRTLRVEFLLKTDSGYPKDTGGVVTRGGGEFEPF